MTAPERAPSATARRAAALPRTLHEIAQALESADGAQSRTRVQSVLELLRRIVPYDQCGLLEAQPGRRARVTVVPPRPPRERAALRAMLARRLALLAEEADAGAPKAPPPALVPWRSSLTVPLISLDQVVGLLFVGRTAADTYDAQDLTLLSVVAAQLAAYLTALELREQEARRAVQLEAVINTMVEGLAIVDTQGVVRHTNPAWLRLFGLRAGQRTPRGLDQYAARFTLQGPDGRPLAWDDSPFALPLRGGTVAAEDVVLARPDGTSLTLSVSGAPVHDRGARVRLAVLTCYDVTEAHDLQRLRDEFIATASHDLRTPLTVIKGQAQLSQRQIARGDAQAVEQRLAIIRSAADSVTQLLNVLLDSSRIQAGRLDLRPEPMALLALVREHVAEARQGTDRHALELELPAEREQPAAELRGCWERARLGQVLQNLLSNAIKYSPEGGRIRVRVEPEDDAVRVAVVDDGLGIPPEVLPRLFGRFYRGAFAGDRRIEGTGLGLFLVRGIVEAHGGTIWAESAGMGRGSTFRFRLPLQAPGCSERPREDHR